MEQVAISIGIMTGLGVFFATVLATAYRFLRVEEDPRLEVVTDMLPGNNCGACGEPGCGAFADSLIAGTVAVAKCTVAPVDTHEEIASFLGVDVGAAVKNVARLKCAGGDANVRQLAAYDGIISCRGAVVVDGGGQACTWGCLGLRDCAVVCTFDAIVMNDRGLPVVNVDLCTACEDCVDVCPLDLFVIAPLTQKLFVQCNSPLAGDEAREICAVACDACGRCAADEPDVIEMKDGLPVIHFDRATQPTSKATWRCPTNAIQWLEGDQFAELADDVRRWRRHA